LAPAQDHKRLGDGDRGPNTGGMGAFSPVPGVGKDLVEEVVERAIEPTLNALHLRGIDYRGVLYAGLMLTPDGFKVLEYNVRFGDPEAQVVLPRLDCDLAALLAEAAAGRLESEPSFVDDAAVTVVLAAEGYPASPRTGDVIHGLDAAAARPGVEIFYAGVGPGMTTAGGRVLTVTGTGPTLDAARSRAYAAVDEIGWPGMHYRTDIAASACDPSAGENVARTLP
jgi:phosphoribosylamine--glycine ligase